MHGVEFGAGTVFAGYRIDRLLGRGGMGTVYLAAHPRLPRRVALKLLDRELYSDDEVRARFEREADVSAHLDHPGIVSVLDRGVEDGLMWISMQYVDGRDASAFRGEPLAPARAVGIIAQTAEALDYAHDRGVLHRDVKPANILLGPGRSGDRVLLTDFGIARLRGDARQLTRTGAFLATLAYASPEQLSGAAVDHRSDQYSLGCTLFTLLTGESPYPADNPGAVVAAHLTKPVPRASAVVGDLPPGIDAVIARAMAKEPDERFDSCEEFARAAAAALVGPDSASQGRGGSPTGGEAARVAGRPVDSAGASFGREHLPVNPGESSLHPTLVSAPSYAVPRPAAVHGGGRQAVGAVAIPRAGYSPMGARSAGQHAASSEPAGRPPQRAVSSRWRALAVSLIVLALVAGAGVVGVGAIYWKFVRPSRVPPPPGWGAHGSVASGFTGLIPPGPTERGWREANCSATPSLVVLPGDPAPLRQISCTDSDGLIAWYTEYPDAAAVDAYLLRHATEDLTRELHHTSLAAYRPRDPAAPFTLAARERGDVLSANSVVEVSWPGHSFEETRDHWWQQAPF
ncbi:protein kinase [Nocardia fluminea]|uniref:serine/threonine-protein kinase n=1 Tax=Nocardia fluminea TaxID=134984 RepID=UPI00342B2571